MGRLKLKPVSLSRYRSKLPAFVHQACERVIDHVGQGHTIRFVETVTQGSSDLTVGCSCDSELTFMWATGGELDWFRDLLRESGATVEVVRQN